jgi:hypothetical protein
VFAAAPFVLEGVHGLWLVRGLPGTSAVSHNVFSRRDIPLLARQMQDYLEVRFKAGSQRHFQGRRPA